MRSQEPARKYRDGNDTASGIQLVPDPMRSMDTPSGSGTIDMPLDPGAIPAIGCIAAESRMPGMAFIEAESFIGGMAFMAVESRMPGMAAIDAESFIPVIGFIEVESFIPGMAFIDAESFVPGIAFIESGLFIAGIPFIPAESFVTGTVLSGIAIDPIAPDDLVAASFALAADVSVLAMAFFPGAFLVAVLVVAADFVDVAVAAVGRAAGDLTGIFIPFIPGMPAIAARFTESARAAESRCCLACCAASGDNAA